MNLRQALDCEHPDSHMCAACEFRFRIALEGSGNED